MENKRPTKTNRISFSEDEKKQLKNKIVASIYSYKREKRHIRGFGLGFAASITIILGIFFFINTNSDSSIDEYIKTVKNVDSKDFNTVKLILNDSENINIAEDNSTIKYSNTGKQINISNSKTINQSVTKNDKVVYNTIIVPYGKRSKIELSDGSQVWLNSGSKLVYPVIFAGKKREVYLEGEAIFEVAHDKLHPFMVMAENHEIEVLGTIFNVSNYLDEKSISTTLKSGSVQINYKGDSFFKTNKAIKITPGTKADYHKKTHTISSKKVEVDNYFSWREGIFIFKNDNMEYIMKRLSRYYNVKIVIKNKDLTSQTFSGYLDLKENVENVVEIIKETTDFEYSTENKTITIN